MANKTKQKASKKPQVLVYSKTFDSIEDIIPEFMSLPAIQNIYGSNACDFLANSNYDLKEFQKETCILFKEQVEADNLRFYQLSISSNRFLLKTDKFIEIGYTTVKDKVVARIRLFNPMKTIDEQNLLIETGWALQEKDK